MALFCFFISSTNSEVTMTDEEIEQGRLLSQIFEKIKLEYVTSVSNYSLVAGCFKAFESNEEILAIKPDDDKLENNDSIVGFMLRIVKNQKYPEKFSDRINKCTETMVKNLDTQSEYYTKEDWAFINDPSPDGQAGIGLELSSQKELIVVIKAIEGGSAKKAGLKKGDIITAIDNKSIKSARLDEVLRLIRGTVGSEIELSVVRGSALVPLSFKLVRSFTGSRPTVVALKGKYMYIKLDDFSEKSGTTLSKKIKSILETNLFITGGIILDLRDNPGGLFQTSISISSIFLKENQTIAIVKGNNTNMFLKNQPSDYLNKNEEDFIIKLPNSIKNLPMVVLVNHESASGAEIVAGALQENKRATVIGVPTFGNGAMQTILPMNNKRALKVTTANFLTPLGNKIDGVGIKPDILINQNEEIEFASAEDVQLSRAIEYLNNK